ncbi:Phosphoribosylglycinamide formyltransferase [Moritella sp. JT01]|uniref:phosphoribosylglycinamide formyltransferase n=1 Tax=Moritella sp. JT01 TaxID=756698 RepID=UPI0007974AA2|nr:phosphoribosylglycinamide formyltransferase [Moritella sp. JT01]KXO09912.1 Phosphoribosylglycinamide formyltransferase [Moritella sp. JT01]
MSKQASIVVLISGNGSNLQTILDQCEQGSINGKVTAVFSNKSTAYGLERAQLAGVDAISLAQGDFSDRTAFDAELMTQIDQYQPDLIVLAGYMRILSDNFVQHYAGKMLNIHPSLLPKYPGLDTHQRAIDNGDEEHGASVHFVTPELDSGPVILQAKVPVFSDDSLDDLSSRVHTQEHMIYPMVIQWFCAERLAMIDGKAVLDGKELAQSGYAAD